MASDSSSGDFIGNDYFSIGRYSETTNRFYKGNLDDMRVWNVARSAAEITGNMDCSIDPTHPNLVSSFDFNEGTLDGDNASQNTLQNQANNSILGNLTSFSLSGSTSNWSPESYRSAAITITQHPLSATVVLDTTVTLTASATSDIGCPILHYQWLKNGELIPEAHSNSVDVTLSNFQDGGRYSVLISDGIDYVQSDYAYLSFDDVFYASDGLSDQFIKLDWRIPYDPCLIDDQNDPYTYYNAIIQKDLASVQSILYSDSLDNYPDGPHEGIDHVYSFDTVSAQINLDIGNNTDAAYDTISNWSIGYWIKPEQTDITFTSGNGKSIMMNSNSLLIDDVSNTSISFPSNTNEWNHVFFSVDADNDATEIYLNGSQTGSLNFALNFDNLINFGDNIAKEIALAELYVWDKAFSTAEVTTIYTNPMIDQTNNLIVHYTVDENGNLHDQAIGYDNFQNSPTSTIQKVTHTHLVDTYTDMAESPNSTYEYKLALFISNGGGFDAQCEEYTIDGSTASPFAPDSIRVTTDILDRIEIVIINNSETNPSYQLERDGIDIGSAMNGIAKGDTVFFQDIYDPNSNTSIESNTIYAYSVKLIYGNTSQSFFIGNGQTKDINFSASDGVSDDKVTISWDQIEANGIDDLIIRRDGLVQKVVLPHQTSTVDILPFSGDTVTYELMISKNGETIALLKDEGHASPNGKISGRVVTSGNNLPVPTVNINLTRESNGDIYSTISDLNGAFVIDDIAYGLLDTFTISAVLAGHAFSYPVPSAALYRNQPEIEDIIILDSIDYEINSSSNTISLFTASPKVNKDKITIAWEAQVDPDSLYINLEANGRLLFTSNDTLDLEETISDFDGRPRQIINYELKVFNLAAGDQAFITSQTISDTFPLVSRIADGNFTISNASTLTESGEVHLAWSHSSNNITGYRLYRNAKFLVELDDTTASFIDETAPFNEDLTYAITAFRRISDITYETEVPTPWDTTFINLGDFSIPGNVSTNIKSNTPSVGITWTMPSGTGANYNYDGFLIYRNSDLIGDVPKSFPMTFTDYEGFGQAGIIYSVRSYRKLHDGNRIISAPNDANGIDFPTLPMLSGTLTAIANESDGYIEFQWDATAYNTNTSNYDGFILSVIDNNIEKDIIKLPPTAQQFSYVYERGNSYIYNLTAYKSIDGIDHKSDNISESVVLTSENIAMPYDVNASRNLTGQVKLSWNHTLANEAYFNIKYNGNILGTTDVNVKEFYHYPSQEDDINLEYSVQSVVNGVSSNFVGASADIVDPISIDGIVKHLDQNRAIENAPITILANGKSWIITKTDSSGYFNFELPNEIIGNVTINASPINDSAAVSDIITITNERHYHIEMVYDDGIGDGADDPSLSEVSYASVHTSDYTFAGALTWQLTNDQYTGVEIIRGINPIAMIANGEPSLYRDTTAVPGVSYTYQLRTFLDDENGRTYGSYYPVSAKYPKLSDPDCPVLVTNTGDNTIKLQWNIPSNHEDGTLIFRNGTLFADISHDEKKEIIDSTGLAGKNYVYVLKAYKEVNGETYYSNDVSIVGSFPSVDTVTNITVVHPILNINGAIYFMNKSIISWEYDGANISGYRVYRNGKPIAMIEGGTTTYEDYYAPKDTENTYGVSAIISAEDETLESQITEHLTIITPRLVDVFNYQVTPNTTTSTIQISWDYAFEGITGFEIYSHSTSVTNTNNLVATVNREGTEGVVTSDTIYDPQPLAGDVTYYSTRAYVIIDNVTYYSTFRTISATMPGLNPPTNVVATDGTFDAAVKIDWEYPVDANVDKFLIVKSDASSSVTLDNIYITDIYQRSHLDLFNDLDEDLVTYNYELYACRTVDNVDYCENEGNPNSDTGYPERLNEEDDIIEGEMGTQLGHSVDVYEDWMLVGLPETDSVHLYRLVDGEWVVHQRFGDAGDDRFGHSVAIDEDYFVLGEPEFVTTSNFQTGKIHIYKRNGNLWEFDQAFTGTPTGATKFGWDVAIDGENIVVSHPFNFQAPSGVPANNENLIPNFFSVYTRNNDDSAWISLDVSNSSNLLLSTDGLVNKYLIPYRLGWSVDIDGDHIIVGDPYARRYNYLSPPINTWSFDEKEIGYALRFKIDGNDVDLEDYFFDSNNANSSSLQEDQFGWDVSIDSPLAAVSSRQGRNSSDIKCGLVKIYKEDPNDNMDYDFVEDIFSQDQEGFARFGFSIDMNGNYLAISEPYKSGQSSWMSLHKYDQTDDEYDIIQSPDVNSPVYRPEFNDSGSPNIYPEGFGFDIALSDKLLIIGAPNRNKDDFEVSDYDEENEVDVNVYPFLLFEPELSNLAASDGADENTILTWTSTDPESQIESVEIYRDGVLLETIASSTAYTDDNGTAESGVKYLYEIRAKIGGLEYYTAKLADEGYSTRQGAISGSVRVYPDQAASGVSGVTVTARGIDMTGLVYEESFNTISQGIFNIENLFIPASGDITYILTASYEDHVFTYPSGNEIVLTQNDDKETNIIIQDNTAYIICGSVDIANTPCNTLDSVEVKYYENGGTMETASTYVVDGLYSFVVDPNVSGLSEIKISIGNTQNFTIEDTAQTIQFDFNPLSSNVFTNFTDFPQKQILNFSDHLTYPIEINVVNPCMNALGNEQFIIRTASYDGCVERMDTTDVNGVLNLNLPPKDYYFTMIDVVSTSPSNYINQAVNYLKDRPVSLDLQQIHYAAGGDMLPNLDPLLMVYHTATQFATEFSNNRTLCDEGIIPILNQGERYSFDFSLFEEHTGSGECNITDGYLLIRNAASTDGEDVILTSEMDTFPTYNFVAGAPNLIEPYTLALSILYYSDDGDLRGSKIIPIIIEGARQLPGTGIETSTARDEAGEVILPLFILRDPPGDESYATIESSETFIQTLEIKDELTNQGGLTTANSFTISAAGAFFDMDLTGGVSTSEGVAYEIAVTTTESYSTSGAEDFVGRPASLIIGNGVSTQFGLSQQINFSDNCTPEFQTLIALAPSSFESNYGYTVGFIEDLIDKYKSDSTKIAIGVLNYVDANGQEYSTEAALLRNDALKTGWQDIIHYYDYETVPHYVLCSDNSYRQFLSSNAQDAYDEWKEGFCTMIGTYEGNEFVMNDDIDWTDNNIINAYNNTVAYTEKIKDIGFSNIIDEDLKLGNSDISRASDDITDAYHLLIGDNSFSSEVFDLSGGTALTKSITSQQSSSTNFEQNRFFDLSTAAGLYIATQTDVGLGASVTISSIESRIGLSYALNANIAMQRSDFTQSQNTVSYYISDNDPKDQITFNVLQSPLRNQTPYFIRLGGQTSCPPEEALTPNQDDDPLQLYDPFITVVVDEDSGATMTNPFPRHNVPADGNAIFSVKIVNNGVYTDADDDAMFEVFLDNNSNPFGALVTFGGVDLNNGDWSGTLHEMVSQNFILSVSRPGGTYPFFNFENLNIGIRPECGGLSKIIVLDVHFETPCSPVSLTKPFDGLILDRSNDDDDNQEIIGFELRDFILEDPLVDIDIQYRRLDSGEDWKSNEELKINRQEMIDATSNLALGVDPTFLRNWDITGEYNTYPDGIYLVRARSNCGTAGKEFSNEVEIVIDRAETISFGAVEPADQIWVAGDEISVTYDADISDDTMDDITLISLDDMSSVSFSTIIKNNKVTLVVADSMGIYDGKMLRASYPALSLANGSISQPIIWDFEVITQKVDFIEENLDVYVYPNQSKTVNIHMYNPTPIEVTGLTFDSIPAWASPIGGLPFSILPGDYTLQMDITGTTAGDTLDYILALVGPEIEGRIPTLNVTMYVLTPPPPPGNGTNLKDVKDEVARNAQSNPDTMELIVNWAFLDELSPSRDTFDQIQVYMHGEARGLGFIKNYGDFHAAKIMVHGDAGEEEGDSLSFLVWNSDQAIMYQPVPETDVKFLSEDKWGVTSNPEVLIVKDEAVFEIRRRLYVDSTNIAGPHDGLSWGTAFHDLQDALEISNVEDTIWMAQGTYFPSDSDRDVSFVIPEKLMIYGGFLGTESKLDQRPTDTKSILSGDINIAGDDSDNNYHVVEVTGTDVLFDQLDIRSGNADGSDENSRGACLYNTGILTLQNCSMRGGIAADAGRLIYNSGQLTIQSGTFQITSDNEISSLQNEIGGSVRIGDTVQFTIE